MALFESYERRIDKINATLKEYGISSVEECRDICLAKGIDCDKIVRETQPICFENAVWAYTVGAAIAIKKGCVKAADAAAAIGIGLQSFCIPGSVAENRKVGLGHGNLGKMTDFIKQGLEPNEAYKKARGTYGRFDGAYKYIDPRHEQEVIHHGII